MAAEIESKSARAGSRLYDITKPENLSGQSDIYAAFWVFRAFCPARGQRGSGEPGARSGRADTGRAGDDGRSRVAPPFAGPGHARGSVGRDQRREGQAFIVSAVSP